MVVKPNSTNFGEGVTILEKEAPLQAWTAAFENAFSLDTKVLVEEFATGLEFRFLVIGGQTRAVLHRMPANVVGDGTSSIRTLVTRKNLHPWRGEGYRRPLEKLRLDETEVAFLADQDLTPDSVPLNGQRVFLRKNSNISTGGDSIDFTDAMPRVYSETAENAVRIVGAQICGLDMIIPDWKDSSPGAAYTILELNFNPALHIHAFPAEGKRRRGESAVLDLLGW
jgi:glutamate--cysteine ligase